MADVKYGVNIDVSRAKTEINELIDLIREQTKLIGTLEKSMQNMANKQVESVKKQTAAQKDYNKQLNQAQAVQKLQLQLENKIEMEKAKQTQVVSDLTRKLNSLKKTTKELNDETEKGSSVRSKNNRVVDTSKNSINALRERIRLLKNETENLNRADTQQNAQYKKKVKELRDANLALRKYNDSVEQQKITIGSLGRVFRSYLSWIALAKSISLAGAIVGGSVRELAEWSDALADVRKTTGLTQDQVEKLSDSLKRIDTRTSLNSLLEIAKVGGRMAIQGKDLEAFTETVDKVFVALGDDLGGSAEEIAAQLSKISFAFGLEEEFGVAEGINKVGSAINFLAANTKASAAPIIDFTNRLQGIGKSLKIPVEQMLALGTTFDGLGVSTEISSTAISGLLNKLAKNSEKVAKVIGITGKQLRDELVRNPVNAILQFSEALTESGDGIVGVADGLDNLGLDGKRTTEVLLALGSNTALFAENLRLAREELERGTSATEEFNIKNETFAANLEKIKNNMVAIVTQSGFLEWLNDTTRFWAEFTKASDNEVEINNLKKQGLEALIKKQAEYNDIVRRGWSLRVGQELELSQINRAIQELELEKVLDQNKETIKATKLREELNDQYENLFNVFDKISKKQSKVSETVNLEQSKKDLEELDALVETAERTYVSFLDNIEKAKDVDGINNLAEGAKEVADAFKIADAQVEKIRSRIGSEESRRQDIRGEKDPVKLMKIQEENEKRRIVGLGDIIHLTEEQNKIVRDYLKSIEESKDAWVEEKRLMSLGKDDLEELLHLRELNTRAIKKGKDAVHEFTQEQEKLLLQQDAESLIDTLTTEKKEVEYQKRTELLDNALMHELISYEDYINAKERLEEDYFSKIKKSNEDYFNTLELARALDLVGEAEYLELKNTLNTTANEDLKAGDKSRIEYFKDNANVQLDFNKQMFSAIGTAFGDMTGAMIANQEDMAKAVGQAMKKLLISVVDAYLVKTLALINFESLATFGASLVKIAPALAFASAAKAAINAIPFKQGGSTDLPSGKLPNKRNLLLVNDANKGRFSEYIVNGEKTAKYQKQLDVINYGNDSQIQALFSGQSVMGSVTPIKSNGSYANGGSVSGGLSLSETFAQLRNLENSMMIMNKNNVILLNQLLRKEPIVLEGATDAGIYQASSRGKQRNNNLT